MTRTVDDSPVRHLEREDRAPSAAGTDYAAAVRPIAAQSEIRTDDAGLTAGPVTIEANGVELPAYRAMPAGGSRLPVVLVVSEISACTRTSPTWRGVSRSAATSRSRRSCSAQGDARATTTSPGCSRRWWAHAGPQVMADLDACVAWAAAYGATLAPGRHRFCWGGRLTGCTARTAGREGRLAGTASSSGRSRR